MPHQYRFSADAMTEFSLVAGSELYFLLGFSVSVSVSVYGLGGSTGFDFQVKPFTCFYKI